MSYAVKIDNLIKKFNNPDITALDNVSINLKNGEVIGLIGPDGAGKTTLIRILLGLMQPTSGIVSVLGMSPLKDTNLLHQKIGYMPQKFGLYEDLTVQENINLFADIKKLSSAEKKQQYSWLLHFTGLKNFTNRLAGNLSGGMKQKLGLGCTLLGRPKLLLLDEPGVGVDPISRKELMKMVYSLKNEGITVLWSTSYLDEAEKFDNVLLLNEGKLIFNGNPHNLTENIKNNVFVTKSKIENPRIYLRKLINNKTNLIDASINAHSVRLVIRDEKVIKQLSSEIIPTTPRFEDAVIDILGGANLKPSPLAEKINIIKTEDVVIRAGNLTKSYGNFYAAKNISFNIKKGEIFGLLGPNGAGKSTTFKMLCGLIKPTSGKGFILNEDMIKNADKARKNLGYMAQKFSLFSTLSVIQNLNFFAGIYGLSGSTKKQRINQMIETFELSPYLNQSAGMLPLGFKQRLALSCAIMHNPSILFLDEPTSGVDPLTRREFWNHINSMVEKGVTVMVTTHFMDEAEYCDRIALIYEGQAITTGAPEQLKQANENMEDAFIRIIENFNKEDFYANT